MNLLLNNGSKLQQVRKLMDNMKKILYTLLLGTAVMACSKESVEYEAPDTEISLVPVTRVAQTKADVTDGAVSGAVMPDNYTLTVSAYYDNDYAENSQVNYTDFNTAYFENATFTKENGESSNIWAGSPTKYYWPKNGALIFAAYAAPSASVSMTYTNADADKFAISNYKQPAIEKTEDILYSMHTKPKPVTTSSTSAVAMDFKHALTWVTFLFNSTEANAFKVTSVKVNNAVATGSAELTSTGAAWNPTTYDSFEYYSTSSTDDGTVLPINTNNKTTEIANSASHGLLIPVTLQGNGNTTNNVELEVAYKFKKASNSTDYDVDQVYKANLYDIVENCPTGWEAGTHYIYTLTFGRNEIKVAPTVTEWTENIISIEP